MEVEEEESEDDEISNNDSSQEPRMVVKTSEEPEQEEEEEDEEGVFLDIEGEEYFVDDDENGNIYKKISDEEPSEEPIGELKDGVQHSFNVNKIFTNNICLLINYVCLLYFT